MRPTQRNIVNEIFNENILTSFCRCSTTNKITILLRSWLNLILFSVSTRMYSLIYLIFVKKKTGLLIHNTQYTTSG